MKLRRHRHSADTIARSLRRVRLIVGLAAAVLSLHAMRTSGGVTAVVGLACSAFVLVTVVVEARLRRIVGVVQSSMLIVVADTAMVITVLGVAGVHPGAPAALLLVLPLIQAGVRHGVLGAFTTWFVASLAIFGQLTIEWDGTPGQVQGPMGFAVGLLLIALPTASLSDLLAERMHQLTITRGAVDARADALADVLSASVDIARADSADLHDTVLRHARRLCPAAIGDAEIAPTDEGAAGRDARSVVEDNGMTVLRFAVGGTPPAELSMTVRRSLDPFTIEAMELLALTARNRGHHQGRELTDPDATVEQPRIEQQTTPIHRWSGTGPIDRRSVTRLLTSRLVDAPRSTQVALVALDNRKLLSDVYGVESADELVVASAERLASIAGLAHVGRLSDDELLVITDVGDVSTSLRLTIRRALAAQVQLRAAGRTTIQSSIGFAISTEGDTATQLIRRARESMYADTRQQNREFLAHAEADLAGYLTGTS